MISQLVLPPWRQAYIFVFTSCLLDPKFSKICFLVVTFRKSAFILESECFDFILFSQWNY